ncbi:phage baseplate assembly protein V [Pseudomonas sp. HK3]
MNKFSITLAGTDVGSSIDIIDLEIQYRVNDIPFLKLSILEDNIKNKDFEIISGKEFSIGKEITVLSIETKKVLFKGIITAISLGKNIDTYLEVKAHSDVIKMSEGLSTQLFKSKITDDKLINELMTSSGVTVGDIAVSEISHYQYFSYQVTPWRLMMSRILANGFVFSASTESNSVINIQDYAGEKKTLNILENNIIHFEFNQDIRSQIKNISVNAWDITQQKLHSDKGVKGKVGQYKTPDKAVEALAISDMVLFSNFTKSPKELEAQATAQNNYRLLDANQGIITLEANVDSELLDIKLMDTLTVEKVGATFSGDYLVSGIRHYLMAGQWQMDIDLGIPITQTLQSDYMTLPLIPLMNGKVVKYKADAEEIERLPIQLPALAGNDLVWARPLSPFASNGEGLFFPPNIGDEVIVSFIDGDCRYPVIVGSCHNPKLKPPQALQEEKPIRGIYVKQKDEEVPVSVKFDKSSDVLALSSGKSNVQLSDAEGSKIVCEKTIDISSKGATSIKTDETISIVSKGKISISTDEKAEIKSQAVEIS